VHQLPSIADISYPTSSIRIGWVTHVLISCTFIGLVSLAFSRLSVLTMVLNELVHLHVYQAVTTGNNVGYNRSALLDSGWKAIYNSILACVVLGRGSKLHRSCSQAVRPDLTNRRSVTTSGAETLSLSHTVSL